MIIGLRPGAQERRVGKPFVGQSGELLASVLEATGWSMEKTFRTNLYCDSNTSFCIAHTRRFIEAVNPKLIIAMGVDVWKALLPNVHNPLSSPLWSDEYGCYVLCTYNIAAILHHYNASQLNTIVHDLACISRILDSSWPPHMPPHVTTQGVQEAERFLAKLPRDKPVAIDVETTNLDVDYIDPLRDRLLSYAISDGDKTLVVTGDLLTQLTLPKDIQWTCSYGVFDVQVLEHLANQKINLCHDTVLMHYVLDEYRRRHDLKRLSRHYLGAGFYEKNVDRRHLQQNEATFEYNARDAVNTARIANLLLPQVKADGVERAYELLMQAAPVYAAMQHRGIPINYDELIRIANLIGPEEDRLSTVLKDKIGRLGFQVPTTFRSPQQMARLLYDDMDLPEGVDPKKPRGTGKDILKKLHESDTTGILHDLEEYRQVSHIRSTYVEGIMHHTVFKTGRVHPTPFLTGTETGRLTYTSPAMQTIPRAYSDESKWLPMMRHIFGYAPDSNRCIIECDLERAEIWTAWMYSQDAQIRADLADDYHTVIAMDAFKVPRNQVTSAMRSNAKRTTFGILYGIGAAKLSEQTSVSQPEAMRWLTRWKLRNKTFVKWAADWWNSARQTGEVQTLFGRKRRYHIVLDEGIRNEMVNMPIQSTSHDFVMSAIIAMAPRLAPLDAHPILDIHDAVLVDTPVEHRDKVAAIVAEEMSRPRLPGLPGIPAEIKWGYTWGSMKPL